MRLFSALIAVFFLICPVSVSTAGSVYDRVKARGVVRCGSVERPGLADVDGDGHWTGLEVDICRAVATAVLSAPERMEYHKYETPKDFDAVRNQQDDLYFLTGSEIATQNLAEKVLPGPTVFVESHNVMVATKSNVHQVSDLSGDSICFMIGSACERTLDAYFDGIHKSFLRRPFSEDGEMADTYAVQNCHAVAGEITTLASIRLEPGVNNLSSRILPDPLAVFPIMASTGTADGRWSSVVAWTVHTLISAERHETKWHAGGDRAMPVSAPELGLDKEWQQRVLKAVGNYGDIFDRNLGSVSALKIDRGFNANCISGGLLLSPFLE